MITLTPKQEEVLLAEDYLRKISESIDKYFSDKEAYELEKTLGVK